MGERGVISAITYAGKLREFFGDDTWGSIREFGHPHSSRRFVVP
jgi:hypothetical protein